MLETGTAFTQWENSNELRKFPFTEESSLVSVDGKVLPTDIISDLLLFLPESVYTPQLACVRLGPGVVSVAFSINTELLCSCIVPKRDFRPYVPYAMDAVLPGSSGYITFGDISWPEEPVMYKFNNAADIDLRACIMTPQPGVTSFVDDVSGEELSGIVTMSLPQTVTASIEKTDGVYHVTFDLTDTGRTALSTSCHAGVDDEACGVPVIRSICGVKPNSDGVILLRFV